MPPQVVIEARGRRGLVRYLEQERRVEVEHPSAEVRAAVTSHYEKVVRRKVAPQLPPELADVTDLYDEVDVRGVDSLERFLARTSELHGGTDVLALWTAADTKV